MTDTKPQTPTEEMYERGFGTGHPMDLRPTQVKIEYGRDWPAEDGFQVHNILHRLTKTGEIIGVVEPVPLTMCGLRLDKEGEPYNEGRTTCSRCAMLAAYKIVAVY